MAEPELRRLFYKLIMPGSRALERIERRGLTLDLDRYAQVEKRILEERATALEDLNAIAGWINWNSPKQIRELLYDKLKLKTTVKTKKGLPSTGEDAIVELRAQHPIAETLVEYRELEKFYGTYIAGWKDSTHQGRLYLGYKIHGTVTGRYSSRLHQVPRDSTIRSLITAPRGWLFAHADLSQAELRIAAELSRDLELVTCFRPGGQDVHWRTLLYMVGSGRSKEYTAPAIKTAREVSGHAHISLTDAIEILGKTGHTNAIAVWKGWKEARKKAKAINFGFVFGMYENKFIQQAKTKYDWDCTFEEAKDFRSAYFELYRGIPPWHDRQRALVRSDGYVRNLFGRLRRLPGIYSTDKELRMECERQAINSPVQGTIGDWKAAALIEIEETIPKDSLRIVGEHHDALLMIFRDESRDSVLPQVRAIMRRPRLLDVFKVKTVVPMESEIEIGPWGAGKTYKDPTCQ
jgi:DNA polymerase-1